MVQLQDAWHSAETQNTRLNMLFIMLFSATESCACSSRLRMGQGTGQSGWKPRRGGGHHRIGSRESVFTMRTLRSRLPPSPAATSEASASHNHCLMPLTSCNVLHVRACEAQASHNHQIVAGSLCAMTRMPRSRLAPSPAAINEASASHTHSPTHIDRMQRTCASLCDLCISGDK